MKKIIWFLIISLSPLFWYFVYVTLSRWAPEHKDAADVAVITGAFVTLGVMVFIIVNDNEKKQ